MTAQRIQNIVILGGGTAGWMTAAALSKVLGPRVSLSLIESDEIATIGVGEATIPTIHWFNQLIGLDEAEFLRETKASFKLGIEFKDWAKPEHTYFHPFGRYGVTTDTVAFHQRFARAKLNGLKDSFEDYSLATLAARAGRFSHPSPDPRSPLSSLGYAFHFDASLYAQYLRKGAEARGVKRFEGKVTEITQDPLTGFITCLSTDKGEKLTGDLFIDCSGLRALLISETLKVGFEDWSHWLMCDRAFAVPCALKGPPEPYTRSTKRAAGWQWRIPLQHRVGNGYVFSSAFISDEAARDTLLANLEGEALAEPRLIKFKTGKRQRAWDKNVVSIGLSSGFLEPLESTSIHLIQSGIAKLLSLFPNKDCDPLIATEFNKQLSHDLDNIKDILILHYHATKGHSEALWTHCRHMSLPESLVYKQDHYRRTGRLLIGSDDLFKDASWFAVLNGQGIEPQDYNPLTDMTSPEDNLKVLSQIKTAITIANERLPLHAEALPK
jgi:tryptophan 7-halogenase